MNCKHYHALRNYIEHLEARNKAMANALQLIVRDPRISEWLEQNDPKALEQALGAVGTLWE
jgi:hypothetical protein